MSELINRIKIFVKKTKNNSQEWNYEFLKFKKKQ